MAHARVQPPACAADGDRLLNLDGSALDALGDALPRALELLNLMRECEVSVLMRHDEYLGWVSLSRAHQASELLETSHRQLVLMQQQTRWSFWPRQQRRKYFEQPVARVVVRDVEHLMREQSEVIGGH